MKNPHMSEFLEALCDDLNTPKALAVLNGWFEKLKKKDLENDALKLFSLSGFTPNNLTLKKNLFQLEAGDLILLNKKKPVKVVSEEAQETEDELKSILSEEETEKKLESRNDLDMILSSYFGINKK